MSKALGITAEDMTACIVKEFQFIASSYRGVLWVDFIVSKHFEAL